MGRRHGRDFMVGERLDLQTMCDCLDGAAAAGFATARLRGCEPLLHPELTAAVERAVAAGFGTQVTIHDVMLGQRIDEFDTAGLRSPTYGHHGTGKAYEDMCTRTF